MNNLRFSLQTALLGNFAILTTQGLQQLVRCQARSRSLLSTRPAFILRRLFLFSSTFLLLKSHAHRSFATSILSHSFRYANHIP